MAGNALAMPIAQALLTELSAPPSPLRRACPPSVCDCLVDLNDPGVLGELEKPRPGGRAEVLEQTARRIRHKLGLSARADQVPLPGGTQARP
jgi:hypothetical protein